jgi:hypothetical protein
VIFAGVGSQEPGGKESEAHSEFQLRDDGNLTRDDQWSYWWDAENRLIAMQTRNDLLSSGVIAAGDARRLEFTLLCQ